MRIPMLTLLAAVVVAGTAGPTIASEPPESSAAPAAPAAPTPAAEDDARSLRCLKSTGTRIPPKDGQCVNGPGRVITRDEIEKSGATTAADALQRL